MKIRNAATCPVFIFILFFALFASSCSSQASAKAVARKSVVDYFYLLPDFYFEGHRSKAQRKASLFSGRMVFSNTYTRESIADVKNDYTRTYIDALGSLEIAIFRYKSRDLIAVRRYYEGSTIWFLTYQNGKWKDVTKQVMPVVTSSSNFINYVLPRYGTTIEVRRDLWPSEKRGAKLYDLVWQKGSFHVRN